MFCVSPHITCCRIYIALKAAWPCVLEASWHGQLSTSKASNGSPPLGGLFYRLSPPRCSVIRSAPCTVEWLAPLLLSRGLKIISAPSRLPLHRWLTQSRVFWQGLSRAHTTYVRANFMCQLDWVGMPRQLVKPDCWV